MDNHRIGFTLIELLVVMTLVSLLVIGLLVAIDPVEQIKKGRDTTVQNAAANFYHAETRYYTNKEQFTWGTNTFVSQNLTTMMTDLNTLVTNGELRNTFIAGVGTSNLSHILITTNGSNDIAVCYRPESKGSQLDPGTIFGSMGILSTEICKSQTSSGGNDCYRCLR